jgi:putrescine transport system substrate-binding protein
LPPNWLVPKRRSLPVAALAVVAGLSLSCGGGGDSHSAGPPGAAADQVLNVYNWADYIGRQTIADFERATHIKVVYQTYDSNQTLEATLMVGHSGYDIVSTTTGFYGRQIRAGAYLPLDKSKLPNLKNIDPAVLAIQAGADPGNRYAVPYLHAMNGFVYDVDAVRTRMPDAPVDSLAMLFDPTVASRFADCGVSFLDSPEDVIQLALAYLHRDPNSKSLEDLEAAERTVMAVRPYIRVFDSNSYWHQLASKELCVAIAWSSDYSVAQARAREDGTGAHLAFTLPKEGSNITYNAFLIPASAPHPESALKFLNFILEPKVIAAITNDIHYGNDNLAARPYVDRTILEDPAVYPPPELRARLYLPAEFVGDYDRVRTRVWTRIKTGQ